MNVALGSRLKVIACFIIVKVKHGSSLGYLDSKIKTANKRREEWVIQRVPGVLILHLPEEKWQNSIV